MVRRVSVVVAAVLILIATLFFYLRTPILAGAVNKQTVFLSFLDCFHVTDPGAEARIMLIDDDSGPGIFEIKRICDKLGCKAIFATVPALLDSARCDSLLKWQKEGFGIAIHSYRHDRWTDFTYDEVKDDVGRCASFLSDRGFDVGNVNIVVSPGFNNTSAIRHAVRDMGFKLVVGANIVNPDTTVFQWGRLFVKKTTDLNTVRRVLRKAKDNNASVVLGTHSSILEEFSAEKTEAIMRMAIDMGFKYE